MPGLSITSSIVSIFTYVQNLGVTVNLPKFELPDTFVKAINVLSKFLFLIINYLPKIPAFDIRSQLVILSLGIPVILDIIFIWFVNPLLDTVVHLLDILVIIMATFMLTEGIILGFSKGKIYVIALGGIYLVIRCILIALIKFVDYKKEKETRENAQDTMENYVTEQELERETLDVKKNLNAYVKRICDLFMTTIVPDVKTNYDYDELQRDIRFYSKTVQLKAGEKANKLTVSILAILIAVLLVIGLWTHQIISIPRMECPENLKYFFPYICYVIAGILFIFLLLNVFKCGRIVIVKFRHFANRWGLRLLMLFLDLLYIPVITNLVTVITPEHFTCGTGYYLQYSRHKPASDNSIWYPFVNHSWDCLPCYPALVSTRKECLEACSGKKEWRILGALNLKFFDDVLVVDGGILLFNIIAFLIGIPVLWRIIIRRNRSAIKRARVYGAKFEQKWSSILDQLQTTGIFLFFTYRINYYNWSLILIFVKLLVMIVTTLAGRVNSNVYWALPVLYILIFITSLVANPDIFGMNYILNLILYGLNIGFSLIPLLPIFGLTLPNNIILIISIAIIAVPILATAIMLLCKEYPHIDNDPTFLSKKEIKKKKKELKKKKESRKNKESKKKKDGFRERNFNEERPDPKYLRNIPGFKLYDIDKDHIEIAIKKDPIADNQEDNFDIISFEDPEGSPSSIYLQVGQDDPLSKFGSNRAKRALFIWDVKEDAHEPNIQSKEVQQIAEGMFDSIETLYHVYNRDVRLNKDGEPEYYRKTRAFSISKRVIYNRAKRMYEMIDIILDGATIELLTKTLNAMILFGGFAFGWFLGALFATESKSHNIFCG